MDAWAVPGPPETEKIYSTRELRQLALPANSLDGVGVAFFEVGRLAAEFFRIQWPRGFKPLFMPATSAIDFKFNRGYKLPIPPGLTRDSFQAWNELWGEGGAPGEDSTFFDRPMIGIPRVWLERVSVWRFMEIGAWFTSGWVSNGMEELSSNVNYWGSVILELLEIWWFFRQRLGLFTLRLTFEIMLDNISEWNIMEINIS